MDKQIRELHCDKHHGDRLVTTRAVCGGLVGVEGENWRPGMETTFQRCFSVFADGSGHVGWHLEVTRNQGSIFLSKSRLKMNMFDESVQVL